jgi:hypothetical protein
VALYAVRLARKNSSEGEHMATDQASYSVTVHVTNSGNDIPTTVDLTPSNLPSQYGTTADFYVTFTGVPNGNYTARGQYGSNTTVEAPVTVNNGDAQVTLDMTVPVET